MTEESQRIAIAEACGWTKFWEPDESGDEGRGKWLWHCGNKNVKRPPDYLNDLNAIWSAEDILTIEQRYTFTFYLAKITEADRKRSSGFIFTIAHASAAQRAEAFLKTKGLWKDEE